MTQLASEMVDVGGRSTEVIAEGSGPALVFLHGGGILEGFDCFAPLVERFRFVAPLMPGFGRSDLRPPIQSIDHLVSHTGATLDALGIDSFVLVGHSLGGWVASAFAAAQPERVTRLLVAAPYGLDTAEAPLANIQAMSREELYGSLTRDPAIFEGLVPDGDDEDFEAARALEGQSMAGFVPGPFDPAHAGRLAKLEMPVAILWGEDDKIVPVGNLPTWKAALPSAETRVFPGVGHLLFHEHPLAVAAIAEFAGR
ncbi:MAG TPA: alpha/beta fold hydrolase [Solirubrobacteraceae bacterium]